VMVRKVTVSLPDELAAEIDAAAAEQGVSRSEIVQEASAHYLALTVEERAAEERRSRAMRALEGMKRIAAMPKRDPRPSLEILREIRETDDSAPMWEERVREGTDE